MIPSGSDRLGPRERWWCIDLLSSSDACFGVLAVDAIGARIGRQPQSAVPSVRLVRDPRPPNLAYPDSPAQVEMSRSSGLFWKLCPSRLLRVWPGCALFSVCSSQCLRSGATSAHYGIPGNIATTSAATQSSRQEPKSLRAQDAAGKAHNQ